MTASSAPHRATLIHAYALHQANPHYGRFQGSRLSNEDLQDAIDEANARCSVIAGSIRGGFHLAYPGGVLKHPDFSVDFDIGEPIRYRFIEDPGHGWLEVNTEELVELGIVDKITRYSYVSLDGSLAYLEEDCDLSTFARAKGWTPETIELYLQTVHQENTFVRGLPSFGDQS